MSIFDSWWFWLILALASPFIFIIIVVAIGVIVNALMDLLFRLLGGRGNVN
jgi:hypothetical protein